MRAKVTFTKKIGAKASAKQTWTPDCNTIVMKENKAIAQKNEKCQYYARKRPENCILT